MIRKLVFLLLFFFVTEALADETIRVLIVKNTNKLIMGGDGVSVYFDRNLKERFDTGSSKKSFLITSENNSININGTDTLRKQLYLSTESGFIKVNGMEVRDNAAVYLMPDGTISVVNLIDIEDYLIGLINSEISSGWPAEAVKAQAVASRTYALYQKSANSGNFYDLEATYMHQAYGGAKNEDVPSAIAVFQTKGEVLKKDGRLIEAFFHSNCGGITESAKNYFNKNIDYLQSVSDEHCKDSPFFYWRTAVSESEIEKKLKGEIGKIKQIKTGLKNSSGRIATVVIVGSRGSKEMSGKDFRALVGYSVIKSTNFSVRKDTNYLIFTGKGAGHGLGMCQWGAKGMALKGMSYKEILGFYYKNTEVVGIDGN